MNAAKKRADRVRRHRRVRKKIWGSAERPRLAVFRSNRHIYAQLVDDAAGRTLAAASSLEADGRSDGGKRAAAKQVGSLLAQRAREAGIERAVFDRGGFLFHGRVKELADAAREGGLTI
ncbi:MAG TPA: 50S ribosomal protein L18 [Actinomycetota bacterium]|nr:50S ribosomal protein L18 [Actinomycetota bacterium]